MNPMSRNPINAMEMNPLEMNPRDRCRDIYAEKEREAEIERQ